MITLSALDAIGVCFGVIFFAAILCGFSYGAGIESERETQKRIEQAVKELEKKGDWK